MDGWERISAGGSTHGFATLCKLFGAELLRSGRRLVSAIAAALALGMLAALPPLLIAYLIDGAIANTITSQAIALALAGFVLFGFADGGLTLLRHRLTAAAQIDLRAAIAPRMFDTGVRLPLGHFRANNHAALIRSFDDLDEIVDFVAGTMPEFLSNAALVLSYASLLLIVNPVLAAVALSTVAFTFITAIGFGRRSRLAFSAWLADRDRRFMLIVEAFSSILTIKSLSAHGPLLRRFGQDQAVENASLRAMRDRMGDAESANRIWLAITPGIVVGAGAFMVMQGMLTVGQLVLFLTVSGSLSAPVGALCNHWEASQRALASLDRISGVRTAKPEDVEDGAADSVRFDSGLRLEDVSHCHEGAAAATLDHIDLVFPGDEHVSVTGRSGEGKTTLAHLVSRLAAPTAGALYVGATQAESVALGCYRRRVLVVPHAVDLFSASLRENLSLWDGAYDEDRVRSAAELAGLGVLIAELPDGYATQLSSSGEPLSAGQRQRVGIARAMLREPDVLILDEATSALDAETERLVIANVRAAMKGKMLIVITHRRDLAESFPRRLIVEGGRVSSAA